MRQRNAKFAKDAREGKKPTHKSRQEQLKKSSPINVYALGVVVFVICGGGSSLSFDCGLNVARLMGFGTL